MTPFKALLGGTLVHVMALLLMAATVVASPPPEVLVVPREDMPNLVGNTTEGLSLPLHELLALVERTRSTPTTSSPLTGVRVSTLAWRGVPGEALALEGELSFTNTASEPAAVRVASAAMPWTTASGANREAMLVRWHEATWLVAAPNASGTLKVGALVAPRDPGHWVVPALDVPAVFELVLAEGMEPIAGGSPQRLDRSEGDDLLRVWPVLGRDTTIQIRRRLGVADEARRATLDRTLAADGASLIVLDELTLRGRFAAGEVLAFDFPAGLEVLQAEALEDVAASLGEGRLKLRPRRELTSLRVRVRSVPRADAAEVGAWSTPDAVRVDTLSLRASATHSPVLVSLAPSMIEAQTTGDITRAWKVWGALPSVAVAVVPTTSPRPPTVATRVRLGVEVVAAEFSVDLKGSTDGALEFTAPEGWSLVSVTGLANGAPAAIVSLRRPTLRHRVEWQPGTGLDRIDVALQRPLTLATDAATDLALPRLGLAAPPLAEEIIVGWDESLDVRLANHTSLTVIPEAALQLAGDSDMPVGLALRATAPDAAATLSVARRAPDVRAVVATLMSIEQDRAVIRTALTWRVRFAPEDTFRFVLPAGTSTAGVTVNGAGLRESTSRPVEGGEEWTLQTQHGVSDTFTATLEWSMPAPGDGPVEAPLIDVRGVSAQEGWIALEASPSLRLAPEARLLAEADPDALPAAPWRAGRHLLGAWRYLRPPYELRVGRERFTAEEPLRGLVTSAELTTTLTPEGERLTEARYEVMPRRERQFFELELPREARLWAVLVDGRGEKPATRTMPDGTRRLMVPLPAASKTGTIAVRLLYREAAAPLGDDLRLDIAGPRPIVPVHRTAWNLSLPAGYEYLAFDGSFGPRVLPREPVVTFLRSAYYPGRLIFLESPLGVVVGVAVVVAFLTLVTLLLGRLAFALRRERKALASVPSDQAATGCATRVVELLVIGGIVLVLAAIAVPNFLEAQVRSKVSRVHSDLRTLATAIEAYHVDNNRYPPEADILWQGSVKYLTGAVTDAMSPVRGTPLRYHAGIEALDRGRDAGLFTENDKPASVWMAYSVGPDMTDNDGRVVYDPSNGTTSAGDLLRTNGGSSWDTSYGQRVAKAATRALRGSIDVDRDGDLDLAVGGQAPPPPAVMAPFSAASSPGDPFASTEGASIAMPQEQAAAEPEANAPSNDKEVDGVDELTAIPGIANSITSSVTPKRADVGLLSLDVAIPQGGVQRRFEGLFDDARLTIHVLDEGWFLRLRFLVQFATFLALASVWVWRRAWFRWTLVGVLVAALLLPLLGAGLWAGFFNAAVQGCLLALAVPLVSHLTLRTLRLGSTATTASALLLVLGTGTASADAPAPEATPSDTLRIVVPYDADATSPLSDSAVGFLDRPTFEALWQSAQDRPAGATSPPLVAIGDVLLDLVFDEARAEASGRLVIAAVNTDDHALSAALALGEAIVSPSADTPDNLLLGNTDAGYHLVLPPRSFTRTALDMRAPVRLVGGVGTLTLTLPEAAGGRWALRVPFADARAWIDGPAPTMVPVKEHRNGATFFTAPVRPGRLVVSWQANTPTAIALPSAEGWRVAVTSRFLWSTLAWADWRAELTLTATERDGMLPPELRLPLDAGVRLTGAEGEELRGVRREGDHAVLSLEATRETSVVLHGLLSAPEGERWTLATVRPPEANAGDQVVRLEIAEAIELRAVDAPTMRRRSPREARTGFVVREFDAGTETWTLTTELRPVRPSFSATVDEVASLLPGSPLRAARVTLAPQAGVLRAVSIDLPTASNVLSLSGPDSLRWHQTGTRLDVWGLGGGASSISFDLVLRRLDDSGQRQGVVPLRVREAGDTRWTMAVASAADSELVEASLGGAVPMPPAEVHSTLLASAGVPASETTLRAWSLARGEELVFERRAVTQTALTSVFNRVVVSEGVQGLRAVVRSQPRRGRLDVMRARLLLPAPDPSAAARLAVEGPVRGSEITAVGDRELAIVAHLTAPWSSDVEITLTLDQPFDADAPDPQAVAYALPVDEERVQASLLLRRDFEGQFADVSAGAGRVVEPASVLWPGVGFEVRPSDLAFELPVPPGSPPTFRVQRHQREAAVRAVVEVLRLRAIVTEDGLERHELEMSLQNQSEQFLRVALPAPRADITLYEVRVGDRVVDATFGREGTRDVLLVPLIRTGLLQPELTVRVAYTVAARPGFRSGTRREYTLPEVLGDVPVAQSALILMLPTAWSYERFDGSLNRVELVDIEVDEALRRARKVEKLSEALMNYSGTDDVTVQIAVQNLVRLESQLDEDLKSAGAKVSAYGRELKKGAIADQEEQRREERLAGERNRNLDLAKASQSNLMSNRGRLNERFQAGRQVSGQQQQATLPTEAATVATPPIVAAPEPAVAFPRAGDVLVFRQLQGTGTVSFVPRSRVARAALLDVVLALGLAVVLVGGLLAGSRLGPLLVRHHVAVLLAAGIASLALNLARDVGVFLIAGAVVMAVLGWMKRWRT